MDGAEQDPTDPPLTVELLADLQAGLLDDADAARVRRQVRDDPAAQRAVRALSRVRSDVAALGSDATSAPRAPAEVVAAIHTALRSAACPVDRSSARRRAAHLARPGLSPARVVAAVAGLGAVATGITLGTAALLAKPAPTPSAPTTVQHITVPPRATVIPLSAPQILGLLNRAPDFGPLSDAVHRESCLRGLGYPATTQALGARPIDINGRPAVLLVLPGDTPDALAAVAVAPTCNSADTGLVATTAVGRPQ